MNCVVLANIVNAFKAHINVEASRGAAARGVTVKPTGCGFDPHTRR